MKIRKAEEHEKRKWQESGELYPLHGYVRVQGVLGGIIGYWCCEVEYLGEGKDEPNWEIHAPKGMHFDDKRHTIIGTTQQDMLDQVTELVECIDC